MLTLETGTAKMRSKASGFTLIELLIVIFIISILVGIAFVVPTGNTLQKKVKEESDRLTFLFQRAKETALLSGNEIGFSIVHGSYQWSVWSHEQNKWLFYEKGSLSVQYIPESLKVLLDSDLEEPDVIFYSNGTMTRFEMTIDATDESGRYQYKLKSNGANILVTP